LWRRSPSSAAAAAAGLVLAALCLAAAAGVGTSSFTAQALVPSNCTISASPLAFGGYDPIGANRTTTLNATGTITVTCVKGTSPSIALGSGLNASGTTRRMRDVPSGDFLVYEIYQPSSATPGAACSFPGTTVWSSAGGGVLSPGAAPSKAPRGFNVCGSVPAGQNPSVGTYADTVVATVNF
jgi:spore coat protein U-like protein